MTKKRNHRQQVQRILRDLVRKGVVQTEDGRFELVKKVVAVVCLLIFLPVSGPCTLPVIDYSAITESIRQGLLQIRQAATEVSTLETTIQNYKLAVLQATGIGEAAQIWQQVQQTYGQVMGTVSSVETMGKNFQDLNYWVNSANQAGAAQNSQNYWSTAQKTANTALAQQITQQGQELQNDAATLQRLQSQAGTAAGTNQALGVMNEMSALMSKQLMSMRTLMLADQQAVVAKNGATTSQQASQQVQTQKFYQGNLTTETAQGYHP